MNVKDINIYCNNDYTISKNKQKQTRRRKDIYV